MSLFKTIMALLLTNVIFLTGCFSSASPGMKVLKITGEQYYNDAKRFLRETMFIYDGSKINTVMTNIEKNEDGITKDVEEEARLMIDYLSLLKQYANLMKTSRRPGRKDIEKIYDEIKDRESPDYRFLRLLYYYLKSYSHRTLENHETANVYNLLSFFKSRPDYRFPFFIGGEPVTLEFIRYLSYMTLMQNNYIMLSLNELNSIETGNKLHPMYLLTMGEANFRAMKYGEAVRYLKYFRLPTYSTFSFKEYGLLLLREAYAQMDKKNEEKAVSEKMELTLRMRPEDMFCYLSQEEKVMYDILTNDKKEKEVLEDMLDLEGRGGDYLRPDFNAIELHEMMEYYNSNFPENIIDSAEVEIKEKSLYDYLTVNEALDEKRCLLLFDKNEIQVLSRDQSDYFFVKANQQNLRKIDDGVFRFRMRDHRGEEVLFEIESSPKGRGIVNTRLRLFVGENDG